MEAKRAMLHASDVRIFRVAGVEDTIKSSCQQARSDICHAVVGTTISVS